MGAPGEKSRALLLFFILCFLFSCSGRQVQISLYVLEELEKASSIKDPSERLERLRIFINNNSRHPYRVEAYRRVLETMIKSMNDWDSANGFIDELLGKEKEPWIRGEILYEKFSYLDDEDSVKAFAFVDELLKSELYPRMFFYLGYMVGRHEGADKLAKRCYEKAIDLCTRKIEKAQIASFYGSYLLGIGEKDRAIELLRGASGYPTADAILAKEFWDQGRKKEAINYYIRYSAVMPGAREYVKLDSLYTVVFGDTSGLDRELFKRRLIDDGLLPDKTFYDMEGRRHRLSDYRGKKLVIYAWSPT